MMLSFNSGGSQWKVKGQQISVKKFIFLLKKDSFKGIFQKLPTLFERYAHYISMLILFLATVILSNTSYQEFLRKW